MTTLVYIENVLGSGQMLKLVEDFGDYSVARDLMPGENARLVVSQFKTVSVEEFPLSRTQTSAFPPARRGFPVVAGGLALERRKA